MSANEDPWNPLTFVRAGAAKSLTSGCRYPGAHESCLVKFARGELEACS
jgi:hypothetical protein